MNPHDSRPSRLPSRRLRPVAAARLAAALLPAALLPAAAGAQMPGVPTLQSGFVRPGASVGLNYATGKSVDVIGAAGEWTPASARFQLSAGVGLLSPEAGARRTTAGLRAAVPIRTRWTGQPASAFGLAVFAGAGGSSLDEGGLVQVPAGVGLGYRRRVGETRAIALFVTPSYTWTRLTGSDLPEGVANESNLFRTAVGGDLVITDRLGVTAGFEFGAKAGAGAPGAAGGIFGVGAAWVF